MQKTLHIATVGEDHETVMIGIRNSPAHKLVLICLPKNEEQVRKFALGVERQMKMPVSVHVIEGAVIDGVILKVADILKRNRSSFDDVVLNVAGGEKVLTCAAVSAAFVNGIKAFHLRDEMAVMLPILKFSYSKLLSSTKLAILGFLNDSGGKVESLEKLSKASGYGKAVLSYHVRGAEDSKGLEELGLVLTKKGKRGRLEVTLTTQGSIVLNSSEFT